MESNAKLDKCVRCSEENGHCGLYTFNNPLNIDYWPDRHPICRKCLDKWIDDGYGLMWHELHHTVGYELANKFVLDFVGKLD